MIYTIAKVTIKNNLASLNRQIVLYRGDKNVEIQFEIHDSLFRQRNADVSSTIENMGASYGQLIILKPDKTSLVTDITPTESNKIIFTIPPELIDEESELGDYTFQIRLFDKTQESRVTLPPIESGIVIEEPITIV